MLKALRHPPIARLWFGQALSSVGDEIYRVGFTWMAVGLIGADTGYLTSAQAAALMILSFIGGKWADRWDPLRTMVAVDAIRGFVVLVPVFVSFFVPVPLWLLMAVALILSGLAAFFDPALQTVLPQHSPDTPTLKAATGLMMTTIRLARMVGPAIVGFLSGILPAIHFFTLDALTFFFSALSVRPLQQIKTAHAVPVRPARIGFSEAIYSGFQAVRVQRGMTFVLWSKAIAAGTWNLAFTLGFALLVQQVTPNNTRAFGMVMAAYGIGNFLGALYFGNQERRRPALMMFVGYIWLGLGFVLVSQSPTIPWIMAASAVTAFAGTMNEVTFFDLIQVRYPSAQMTKIFRLRLAMDTAATLILLLMAPMLFRLFSVRTVIALCGGAWVVVGSFGCLGPRAVLDQFKAQS